MMVLPLSDTSQQMKAYQKVASIILFSGMLCFLTGFFWQVKYSRLHTLYFILVALPSLVLIPLFFKEQLHKNNLFILVFIFCLYSLVSVFWAESFQASLLVTYLKRVLTLIVLFYAVYHITLHYPSCEKLIFSLLMLSGLGLVAYSLVDNQKGFSGRLELWGGLNDVISSATMYGVLFLLVARAYLIEKNNYLLVFYLFLALLFLAEILLTQSRGPELALVLSTPLIFWVVKPLGYKRIYYPLAFIVCSIAGFLIFSDMINNILSREFSLSYRDVIWKDSINLSLEKPWFGYGLGSSFEFFLPGNERTSWVSSTVSHSHNFILSTWLYSGVLGVLLIVAIIYQALKVCWLYKEEHFSILGIIMIFGVLCLLTNGSYPISRPNERWFVFWIPLAFIVANSILVAKKGQ